MGAQAALPARLREQTSLFSFHAARIENSVFALCAHAGKAACAPSETRLFPIEIKLIFL